MHNIPTPLPTPAVKSPVQHRPRKRRGGKKRRGKRAFPLKIWQIGVLALLLVLVFVKWNDWNSANGKLAALRAQREKEKHEYEQLVASHQVKYREWIEYYAAANRIDPAYVAAVIKRESDYDPKAVSRKDARGLMQLMPDSFDWIAPHCGISKNDRDALFDPESAIKMGCYLLGYISPMFGGDPILVACAYHAGWGNVKGWVEKYAEDGVHLKLDDIPMEDTRTYARKVLNAYAIYQQYYY